MSGIVGTVEYIGKHKQVKDLGITFEPGIPLPITDAGAFRAFSKNAHYRTVAAEQPKPTPTKKKAKKTTETTSASSD